MNIIMMPESGVSTSQSHLVFSGEGVVAVHTVEMRVLLEPTSLLLLFHVNALSQLSDSEIIWEETGGHEIIRQLSEIRDVFFLYCIPQWGTADVEIGNPLMGAQGCQLRFPLLIKPGVGI